MRPPTWDSVSRKYMGPAQRHTYPPLSLHWYRASRLTTPKANPRSSPPNSLQPNGLKVLDLIPGLVAKIPKREITDTANYSVLPGSSRELALHGMPAMIKERTGHALAGVRRPTLTRTLIEEAQARGVPVVFGHQVVGIEEDEEGEGVTVKFANGKADRASFVVGCDGLHSDTRRALFGEEAVSFTGLARVSKRVLRGRGLLTYCACLGRLGVFRRSRRRSGRTACLRRCSTYTATACI